MEQEINRLSLLSMQVEKESIGTAIQAKETFVQLGEFLTDPIMLSSKKGQLQ